MNRPRNISELRGAFSCASCLLTACGGARMASRRRQAIPLKALTHDPSRQTARIFWQPSWLPSWRPARRARCVRGAVRIKNFSKKALLCNAFQIDGPSRRVVWQALPSWRPVKGTLSFFRIVFLLIYYSVMTCFTSFRLPVASVSNNERNRIRATLFRSCARRRFLGGQGTS